MKGPLRSLWGALQMAQGGPLVAQVRGQLWRLAPLVRWLQEEDKDVAVVTRAEDLLARPKGSLTVAVLGAEELRWLNVVRPRIQTQRARVVLFQPTDSEEHKFSLRELAPDLDSWVGAWAELPEEPPDWTIEALNSAPGRFMWRGDTAGLHAALAVARPGHAVVTVPIAEALTEGLRALAGSDAPIVLFEGLHDDVHIRRHLRGVRWALAASGRAGGAVLLGDAPTPPGFVSVTSTPVPWSEALRRLGGGPDAPLAAALTGLSPARLPDDSAWQAAPPTGWLAWSFAALESAPEVWEGLAEPDDDLARPEALTTAALRWPERAPELALRAAETLAVEGLEGEESARVLVLVQRAAALQARAQDPHGLGVTLLRLEDAISARDAAAAGAILAGLSLEGAPDRSRLILADRALRAADAGLVPLAQAVALARPLLSALSDEQLTRQLASGEAALADALLRRLSAHDVAREPKDLLVLTAAALSLTRRGARLTGRLTALIQLLDEQATQLSEAEQLTQAIPLRRERLRLLLAQGLQSSQLVSEAHAELAALLARAGDLAGALAEYEEARRGWSVGWPTAEARVVLLKEMARLTRLVGDEARRAALLAAIWAVVEAEHEPTPLARRVVDELGELADWLQSGVPTGVSEGEDESQDRQFVKWMRIQSVHFSAVDAGPGGEALWALVQRVLPHVDTKERWLHLARMLLLRWDDLPQGHRIDLGGWICVQYVHEELRERLAPMLVNDLIMATLDEPDVQAQLALARRAQFCADYSRSVDLVNSANAWVVRFMELKNMQFVLAISEGKDDVVSQYKNILKLNRRLIYFNLALVFMVNLAIGLNRSYSARSATYRRLYEDSLKGILEQHEHVSRVVGDDVRHLVGLGIDFDSYADLIEGVKSVQKMANVMPRPPISPDDQWYISTKDVDLARQFTETQRERLTHLRTETDRLTAEVADLRQRLLTPHVETFWTATAQEACLDVPPADRAACVVQVTLNLSDSDELGPFTSPRERLERCLLIGAVDPQRPELRVLAPGEPPPPAWLVVYDPDPLTPRVAVRLCDPALDDAPTP